MTNTCKGQVLDYLSKEKKKLSRVKKRLKKVLKRRDFQDSAKNIAQTAYYTGEAARNASITAMTMSGIAVIRGEKSAKDAIADMVINTEKAAATGYVMGGGLTAVSHTLSSSSSKFLRALSKSNVPGKVNYWCNIDRKHFKAIW